MVETSLINLDDAIQAGLKLSAGSKVVLPSGDDADIYGFIVIDENPAAHIAMPPLGECKVFSNRVIFTFDKQMYRFPIFRNVSKASEEKYGLYMLYIPKFLHQLSEWEIKYYKESMSKDKPNPKVAKIDGIIIEEGCAFYCPDEYDLYFDSRSKFRGIGSEFVIITRRFSKLSDEFKYEVFDSYSVKIERNANM